MSIYDRISELCDEKGISIVGLEKELGFGRGSIGKLKKGTKMSAERLQTVANFFSVPVSYVVEDENQDGGYYVYGETAQIAQELFENRDLRLLFDAARDAKPEDLQIAAEMIKRMKGTNE